jgi:hypothetical protein
MFLIKNLRAGPLALRPLKQFSPSSMHSSDSEHSSDDSGAGDDPHQSSAVPNSLLQLQGNYASDSDSVVLATPEKEFNEQDGQSDGSDFQTPTQQSKRRRLPSVSPYKNRQVLFLNRILMVFSSIFYSISPHPASAVSSGSGSLDRLSRNGPLLNAIGRLHTKKLRQL